MYLYICYMFYSFLSVDSDDIRHVGSNDISHDAVAYIKTAVYVYHSIYIIYYLIITYFILIFPRVFLSDNNFF